MDKLKCAFSHAEENFMKLAELFLDSVAKTTYEDGNFVRTIDKTF